MLCVSYVFILCVYWLGMGGVCVSGDVKFWACALFVTSDCLFELVWGACKFNLRLVGIATNPVFTYLNVLLLVD